MSFWEAKESVDAVPDSLHLNRCGQLGLNWQGLADNEKHKVGLK
jgi:hypothetical protein